MGRRPTALLQRVERECQGEMGMAQYVRCHSWLTQRRHASLPSASWPHWCMPWWTAVPAVAAVVRVPNTVLKDWVVVMTLRGRALWEEPNGLRILTLVVGCACWG
jgi:hypothetical protein